MNAIAAIRSALALKLDRRAVTAVEYALIVSLVAIAIVVAVRGVGTSISAVFGTVSATL